ncbi:DUF308 domain-containing protein [Bradyrhizobium sp. 180]|uniref:DUF308 domain-containing protein n=1 Tax=unclassified Bradyrhizobium TaxID=2631580 RepID=UPI001FF978D7|nr:MULTISPECIES: DUF308 domain-containing protein [unclassified Bradyrhizobium]MCK1420204.1 DUF308 domain-containing protein [Bradyrhizobium sp. CW12]MCK1488949.1 DUF308 domain-containing protein [Bradyrhizobium sp. 180]MCK1528089.1 DUF308 domain-containing protein [Bradyrhizobium sp. 182]MCK1597712.1 DUF308 domain-containing protein [Bradyrhizobium sp. 164]MCK1619223.1 DUF308 domain-containing protein [Bradyrhizobium sp. 159]
MTLALLIVGIFAVLAGLLAILFGYTVREFSVGSTLIISGTIGVCTGMLLVGLHLLLLELRGIARRLAAGSAASSEVRVRPVLPGLAMPGAPAPEPALASPAKTEPGPPPPPPGPPPWQSEAAVRERPRAEAPEPLAPPAAPEAPRRRNLLFASTSRKERERAEAKPTEGPQPSHEEPAAPDVPPASFDDAWPKPERMRPPEPPITSRRPPPRSPSTFAEAAPPPPPPAPEPAPSLEPAAAAEQAPVTVLKSGVVDGMAYSLYSDGSIEAQMPEGMMRFASIDELRAHLDQRG